MGWSIGYDGSWRRDIGYGVPAVCDHPDCHAAIDRGLGYVCGGEPYGGDKGCGLYFCGKHGGGVRCARCLANRPAFPPKPDVAAWIRHKLMNDSWARWRDEHHEEAVNLARLLALSLSAGTSAETPEP